MKRIAVWAFYGIGAIAVGYLALYLYAGLTAPKLVPGDPIHIFRKPDAPDYSAVSHRTKLLVCHMWTCHSARARNLYVQWS
jgi:hypothetical protein